MAPWGKKREGILLLNPPFSDSTAPYTAIPQLAGYLKTKGIPLKAKDLSAEFYRMLLTSKAVSTGAEHAKKRFRELNAKKHLSVRQVFEYIILLRILLELPSRAGIVNWLSTPFTDFKDIQEIQDATSHAYLLRLASIPHFPEVFLSENKYLNHAKFSPTSSRDILRSLKDRTYYTSLFKDSLERVWPRVPPKIVGLSLAFTHQVIPAFQIAFMIRQMDPGVHITMGGPVISIYFRNLENPDFFDVVDSLVVDDGEIPLERLYQAIEKDIGSIQDIPGIICRREGKVGRKPPAPSLNMVDLPAPDLGVFDLDAYLTTKENVFFPIRISRGCNWQQCSFCRTDHPLCKLQEEPGADYVFEVLRKVHHEQGIKRFLLNAESANPLVLEQLSHRILKEKLSIEWATHTRISKKLTRQRCELFARAGCCRMAVGIESMSDRVLALMRKGITVKLIQKVLGEINGVLPLTGYMIVGFPTETREEALTSHDLAMQLKQQGLIIGVSYSMFVLQQGSEVYKNPMDFRITGFAAEPEDDLNSDIVGFTGSGMDREQAFELFLTFIKENSNLQEPDRLNQVPIDGKFLDLNYNPEELRRSLRTQWRGMTVPFGKWMKSLSDTPGFEANPN